MKKFRKYLVPIIAGLAGLASLLYYFLSPHQPPEGSIGIIGGADGPTAIYTTGGDTAGPFAIFAAIASAPTFYLRLSLACLVVIGLWYYATHRKK